MLKVSNVQHKCQYLWNIQASLQTKNYEDTNILKEKGRPYTNTVNNIY